MFVRANLVYERNELVNKAETIPKINIMLIFRFKNDLGGN